MSNGVAKKYKILVAEDERLLAKVIGNKLSAKGHEVVIVTDGADAITQIKSEKPDVVYLDIIMPSKDGFEVLEAIKSDTATKKIPVIMYTNLGQKEDIEKAKKMGATDYLVKSDHSLDDAIKLIEKHLPK